MAVSFVRGHLRKSRYGLQRVRRHSRSIRGVRITKRSRVSRAFVPSGLGPNKRGKIPGYSNRGLRRDETVRVTGQAVGARRKKIKAAKRGERNIIPVTGTGARRREAARKGGRLSAANHPTNPPRATSPKFRRDPAPVVRPLNAREQAIATQKSGAEKKKALQRSASRVRAQQQKGVRVKESLRSQNLRVDKDRERTVPSSLKARNDLSLKLTGKSLIALQTETGISTSTKAGVERAAKKIRSQQAKGLVVGDLVSVSGKGLGRFAGIETRGGKRGYAKVRRTIATRSGSREVVSFHTLAELEKWSG